MAGRSVAIVGGHVVPVTGPPIENGIVLVTDGTIAAVGAGLAVPDGVPVIEIGRAHV